MGKATLLPRSIIPRRSKEPPPAKTHLLVETSTTSLTQEVVELRKEVTGHGTDQLLYLAGKDVGLVSDDLVDIAVFQDPGIERITQLAIPL